jgi:hypothetical protein
MEFIGGKMSDSSKRLYMHNLKKLNDGKEIKEAANERFHEVVDSLKKKADDTIAGKGKGINKRKKVKNYVILKNTKKKRTRDIFDI